MYFPYLYFFRNQIKYIEKNISSSSEGISQYISMKEVFALTILNNIFLNIDIEGSEYIIFDSIIENKDRLSWLAIEFHDYDLHLDKIGNS